MVRLNDLLNGLADNKMRVTKFLEFSHSIEDTRPSKDLLGSPNQRMYQRDYSAFTPNMMLLEAVKMN